MSHLALITAGTSSPSSTRLLGERLVDAANAALPGGPLTVRRVDLRDLAVELATAAVSGFPGPRLREAFDAVATASGVIAVTPVMNAGPSGLFELFFDVLDEGAMAGRPVLMGATGGTARHSLAIDTGMLPLFFYLKASPAPIAVYAATDDWGADAGLADRIGQAGRSFAELVTSRPATDHVDDFALVPTFEELLRG